MIVFEQKLSAPSQSGTYYTLHRWVCSRCGRFSAWLLREAVTKANAELHVETVHADQMEAV